MVHLDVLVSVGNDVIPLFFFRLALRIQHPYLIDPPLRNGMFHRIPAVLIWDDPYLADGHMKPSQVSHNPSSPGCMCQPSWLCSLLWLWQSLTFAGHPPGLHSCSFLRRPLCKVTIHTAYIPSTSVRCKLTHLSSFVWYCCHMHSRVLSCSWSLTIRRSPLASCGVCITPMTSVTYPGGSLLVISIGQCQGLTVWEPFIFGMASLEDKAFHGVKDHDPVKCLQ